MSGPWRWEPKSVFAQACLVSFESSNIDTPTARQQCQTHTSHARPWQTAQKPVTVESPSCKISCTPENLKRIHQIQSRELDKFLEQLKLTDG